MRHSLGRKSLRDTVARNATLRFATHQTLKITVNSHSDEVPIIYGSARTA